MYELCLKNVTMHCVYKVYVMYTYCLQNKDRLISELSINRLAVSVFRPTDII